MTFENAGRENTERTVVLARKTAKERGIRHIVVASNEGDTAALLADLGERVVCVTQANGSRKKGENEMPPETRARLEAKGVKVLTTTHVLSGAERSISRKFSGISPVEIMAHTLRMFSQGTKVCVEVAVMALDAGLIPHGEKIVAIGGSGRGADTALILTPSHAADILDTKIHEHICKPE